MSLEIRNLTHSSKTRTILEDLSFLEIKEAILGKEYTLSLVFIGEQRSRMLNKKYKHKSTSANVLSFPLAKKEGEIFITPQRAYRQAKKFNKNKKAMIGYLFIHGLLHLDGMAHGSTMDKAEKKFCTLFNV